MRPTEVKLLAKMMDPECSVDAQDLAKEMIEALDASRLKHEAWIVSARTMVGAPIINVGTFNTKRQAMKAASTLPFMEDPEITPSLGALIMRMYDPSWLEALDKPPKPKKK